MPMLTPAQRERFDAKVNQSDGCWTWTAYRDNWGYGSFTIHGRSCKAHRIAYEDANGPIPDGLEIDHKCHNPACVRPSHLQAVTSKQNRENRSGAQANSKTGIRGVSWNTVTKKWRAAVRSSGVQYIVGYYSDIEEAADAVLRKRNELFTNNLLDRVSS